MPHFTANSASWWNSDEPKIPSSLSKTASLKLDSPPQLNHEAKHSGLQLPDQESSTIQLTGQSNHEVGAVGGTNSQSQCISSESGIYTLGSMILSYCSVPHFLYNS
jgi:nuclear transcription factor Y alpha